MAAKMDNEARAEAFRLREEGWTLQRIADRYGVTRQLISDMIRHNKRTLVEDHAAKLRLDWDAIRDMHRKGMRYREIAEEIGCTTETVGRIVRSA